MKKILSLILVVALCFAFAATASAATDEAQAAAEQLFDYGLFLGKGDNEDGTPNFDLDAEINRVEALTLFVRLLGKDAEAKDGEYEIPFTDVPEWAVGYVGYAYENELTNGISDTEFGSSAPVSATQFLTFVLRALGYVSGEDFEWDNAVELTDEIGFTVDGELAGADLGDALLRGDVVVICAAAIETAMMKDGETTLKANIEANLGYELGNAPVVEDEEDADAAEETEADDAEADEDAADEADEDTADTPDVADEGDAEAEDAE